MKIKVVLLYLLFLFVAGFSYSQADPVAVDDCNGTILNTTLTVPVPGLLNNDNDPDGNPITIVSFEVDGTTFVVGATANIASGSITIEADGSYEFIPTAGFLGDVPVINYIISDGIDTDSQGSLSIVVEEDDIFEITLINSCNQGFDTDDKYRININFTIENTSTNLSGDPSNNVTDIDITSDLRTIYGIGCGIEVDDVNVNTSFSNDCDGVAFPQEFTAANINPSFLNTTSTSLFNANSITNAVLYPGQQVVISFCIEVDAFCNGRPNPTPSGSGINFTQTFDVSTSNGLDSVDLALTDFHSTEGIVKAGLFVPVPNPIEDSNISYDFTNSVVITNEGNGSANNINFNMGLASFLNVGVVFDVLNVTQVSGPTVTTNNAYDGDTNTLLLAPGNNLAAGETIVLEISFSTNPTTPNSNPIFFVFGTSQTQGTLDSFNEDTVANRRAYSYVLWDDALGNHLDRYYAISNTNSPNVDQCSCSASSMQLNYTTEVSSSKSISAVNSSPNGILEHEEVTFQIQITNTSPAVGLTNIQIEEDISNICSGIVSIGVPVIVNSTATVNPAVNLAFNGSTNINIFDGISGTLLAGESITVELNVNFVENCSGQNLVNISAQDLTGIFVNSSAEVAVDLSTDTDNDSITNIDDIDDDNDTIPDVDEYNGLNPLDDDDVDLIPNYRDTDFGVDSNGDGIVDIFDFDSDGVPNHFDLDSDNDGIYDVYEVGNSNVDTNNSGLTNNPVGVNGLDDTVETNDTAAAAINFVIPNTDITGGFNYLDIDSDDDGIVDNIEAQATASYTPPSGTVSNSGLDTSYTTGLIPVDTETDAIPDFIDINSDNDIRDDFIEGWDINNDGTPEIIASGVDNDNDGLDDSYDTVDNAINPSNGQTPLSFPNVDDSDTNERDWRELNAIVILINNVSVNEGNTLNFEIQLVTKNDNTILTQSITPIDIDFSTSDSSVLAVAFEDAVAPFDYTAIVNQVITIPPFTSTETISVQSLEDIIYELDEQFTLTGNITTSNTINTSEDAIGTILNNDPEPNISMNNSREDEGVSLPHIITIDRPSSIPIDLAINTTNNTAISPNDYESINTTFTINGTTDPANVSLTVAFNIPTVIDNINEPFEESLGVIGTVTSGTVNTIDLNKIGIIVDIDPEPILTITDVTEVEGTTMVFDIALVTMTGDPMRNYRAIDLNISTVNITAVAPNDYENVMLNLTISALSTTASIQVNTLDDRLNEDTETYNVEVNSNSTDIQNPTPVFGLGTIKDNDIPNLFTPNNDNASDVFSISGIEDFPNFKLLIIDRWGSEIYNYENKGSINPSWWDGTYKGKPAVEGVYFYTLDFNDGSTKSKTGFIQLAR